MVTSGEGDKVHGRRYRGLKRQVTACAGRQDSTSLSLLFILPPPPPPPPPPSYFSFSSPGACCLQGLRGVLRVFRTGGGGRGQGGKGGGRGRGGGSGLRWGCGVSTIPNFIRTWCREKGEKIGKKGRREGGRACMEVKVRRSIVRGEGGREGEVCR